MAEKTTKILVSVDGSDNSKRALVKARELAEMNQGEVHILTVLDYGFFLHYSRAKEVDESDERSREEIGEAVLEEALTYFEEYDGEVYTNMRNGYPADEILEEAEFGEFDLIVMGSRGLGLFSRTFLGSVSNKVLNHAKSDVLIVK